MYAPPQLSTSERFDSEGFIGVTLNEGRREIYGSHRQTDRQRDRGRAEGRNRVKTGLFEAADLLLLLLTLTFE